jgi:hypothetical protein
MKKGIVAIACVWLVVGCQQPTRTGADASASMRWDAFVGAFLDATFAANPPWGVWAGRHEFDGRLPDWSAAGLAAERTRLRDARNRAQGFAAGSLDAPRRFEREHVLAVIDRDLFWLESMQWAWRSPDYYSGWLDPNVYVSRPYAPLAQRMRAYIEYAKAVPAAAAQIRANLRTPLPRTYVGLGHIVFGGLAHFYENDVPGVFAPVGDAPLQTEFRAANAGAIRAMKELDGWFTQQEGSATEDFALGAEKFAQMLRDTEQVDIPLARLKEIGERDMERNLAALRGACARLAPGQTLEACVARVKADNPARGPVEEARKQLVALRAFVDKNGIVTIPGPELATVAESPPYQRWNAAYIDIPGPYEKNLPSTYYIAPPDPKWTPAEQDAYISGKDDLLFISVHEVWPGHFLQYLHSNRAPSRVGQVFLGYAFTEGWAHYSEEMMWEAGLGDGDPATHVGQLLNALLRNARFLSAIGLHTGGMTVAQSEAMFHDKALQDVGNSRQQAARGTFDPGYGNYTLGKLMIRKLRDDWTASRGGRRSWQAFHDEFLGHGAPPIPMVRRLMLEGDSGAPL